MVEEGGDLGLGDELLMVLVTLKPMLWARTSFGVWLGPVTTEVTVKTSAAATSAAALACTTALLMPIFVISSTQWTLGGRDTNDGSQVRVGAHQEHGDGINTSVNALPINR